MSEQDKTQINKQQEWHPRKKKKQEYSQPFFFFN